MKLGDMPAFPFTDVIAQDSVKIYGGMTLRQYTAIAAMQGMLANAEITRPDEVVISEAAVKIADALLAELEK